MPDESGPEVLIDEVRRTEDGHVLRVKVLAVPESELYPAGVKYRMHFGTVEGETLLRYDNSHGVHERHTNDGVEEIDFPGFEPLYHRFRNEISQQWGDQLE